MKTVPGEKAASGKQKSFASVSDKLQSQSALARIEVRRIDDKVRFEVTGESPDAVVLVQQFVGALNGRTFDIASHLKSPAFDRPIRLESVGFGDDEEVNSIALEADLVKTILHVDDAHARRAAAFCQRHRHTTTTEAMDDLATEFERVSREAKASALRLAADWCSDQSALAAKVPTPIPTSGGTTG